jgi:hypothetical protein
MGWKQQCNLEGEGVETGASDGETLCALAAIGRWFMGEGVGVGVGVRGASLT